MMEVITDGDGAASGTEVVDQNNQAISVVHVAIPNQPVQVQSVIHPNQPSVIQTTGGGGAGGNMQTIQVISADDDDDPDGKKRREILARRPSYRRILNDLSSSDGPVIPGKIEEESSNSSQQDSQEATDAANNLSQASALQQQLSSATIVPAQALQLAQGDGGLQTLTMSNVSSAQTSTTGATIVQYAQGPDGQFFIPVTSISAGNVQAYQITTTPSSIPQGVVMATTGSAIASPHQLSEEASRKRELRLLKNRDAARECRRKKKDYIKCLENRVAVLENQNKTLIEELQSLKELYCQKEG